MWTNWSCDLCNNDGSHNDVNQNDGCKLCGGEGVYTGYKLLPCRTCGGSG